MVRLKTSVYWKKDGENSLQLVELVPKKKIHKFKLKDRKVVKDIECFLDRLSVDGLNKGELDQLLKHHPILRSVYDHIRDQHLLRESFNYNDPEWKVYSRQLEFFDEWIREGGSPIELQQKLKEKTVWIIGAGGTGVAVSNLLVSVGIGTLVIFDFDTIEEPNLLRQFMYTNKDIGRSKAQVLKERLMEREISTIIAIDKCFTVNSIEEFAASYPPDIVVGLDYDWLNENINEVILALLDREIPILFLSEQSAGPLIYNKEDFYYVQNRFQRFYIMREWMFTNSRRKEEHPSYAPFISIAAGLGCDQIVRFFNGYSKVRVHNSVYSLDPITCEVKFIKL